MDEKLLGAVIGAGAGLIGGVIALVGRWLIDLRMQKLDRRRHAAYLAVRVVYELDRFVTGCIDVAQDRGYQSSPNGRLYPYVKEPVFEPHALPVDWKSIDVDLVYEVLTLPGVQAAAERRLDASSQEYDGDDGSEFLYKRRGEFIELGILAFHLARRLRALAKLQDPEDHLLEWLKELQDRHNETPEQRDARFAAALAQLSPMPLPDT